MKKIESSALLDKLAKRVRIPKNNSRAKDNFRITHD